MKKIIITVTVEYSVFRRRRCRNSFRGYRLPDHMLNTLSRLKGAVAVDILALVVDLFGLFRQIAAQV